MNKPCVICDIDGTIAIRVNRGPYEWSKVDQDASNAPVVNVIRALHAYGYSIVFTSGRKAQCRDLTAEWLAVHFGSPDFQLLMRDDDDNRPDHVIKQEMLDIVKRFYTVICAFDDRQSVVDMWRANGIVCMQVNPGPLGLEPATTNHQQTPPTVPPAPLRD